MDTPELKAGLFGYSRKSVQAFMNECDLQMVQSAQEVRGAEIRTAELMLELESTRREAEERAELIEISEASTARLQAQLEDAQRARSEADLRIAHLETRIGTLQSELEDASAAPTPTVEGMKDVLEATQQAVTELLEGGRRSAEQEVRTSERARDALRSEIKHLVVWRDKVMLLADEVRRSIDAARAHTSALAANLAELAETSPPVALVAAPEVIRLEEAEPEAEPPAWKQVGTGA